MAPYFLALRAVTQRNLAFFLERQDAIQVTKTNQNFIELQKTLRKFCGNLVIDKVNYKKFAPNLLLNCQKIQRKYKAI